MSESSPVVLVVDDEPGIMRLVKLALAEQTWTVVEAVDGATALRLFDERSPDLVVLDLTLPDLTGFEVMAAMREKRPVPVIMLTAKGSDVDKIRGLSEGADDYIAKPFSPDELTARVRAILRRTTPATASDVAVRFADIEVNLSARLVKRNGEHVPLTRNEWQLLELLAQRPGKVVNNRDLLSQIWGSDYVDEVQYLRVWISRLRKKIEPEPAHPRHIVRVDTGYKLDVDGRHDAIDDVDGDEGA